MRAMTVIPGQPGSAELTELPDPTPADGELLVEPLYLGVCGTDREIVDGVHGEPPPGRERLVIGHELLGRVKQGAAGLEPGQLVAGIVRRPDPVPCACCAQGEWDMCRNGQYTERGIKALDGYGAELVTIEADFAVPIPDELGTLGVLTEPSSVLAKAWEQIERISTPRLLGARARARDRRRPDRPARGADGRPARPRGARARPRHRGREARGRERARRAATTRATSPRCAKEVEPDVVVECTGVAELVAGAMQHTAPGAIVCLTGVAPSRTLSVDVGALNNELVLENDVVFGSVNANRRHFEQAVEVAAATRTRTGSAG